MFKKLILATVLAFNQLPTQVQTAASSQNLTLAGDQLGGDHYIAATSLGTGLKYKGTGMPPVPLYVNGQFFIMTTDVPNTTGATLDLGPGPASLQGTCNQICLVLPIVVSNDTTFVIH